MSGWAAQQLRACAGELDGAVENRRRQIVQLGELMGAPVLPATGTQPLTGLFADHDVVVGTTAWGRQLALRPHAQASRR
ncbi:MAG: hypothetical protein KF830_02710 [Planctomycetes bacterium]|nr:hypothetical protein [Planctomycetota bacterium]